MPADRRGCWPPSGLSGLRAIFRVLRHYKYVSHPRAKFGLSHFSSTLTLLQFNMAANIPSFTLNTGYKIPSIGMG